MLPQRFWQKLEVDFAGALFQFKSTSTLWLFVAILLTLKLKTSFLIKTDNIETIDTAHIFETSLGDNRNNT